MVRPYRVRVLSSYIYSHDEHIPHRDMARDNRWFHGFTKSVLRRGSGLADFDIQFLRLPPPPSSFPDVVDRVLQDNAHLVICAGVDAVTRWAPVSDDIPTVYFGGHPENHGLDVLARPNVTGVRLNLPVIWSFENFSIIRDLLPGVREIFVPVSPLLSFAPSRANYRAFRRQRRDPWISGPSSFIGFRSLYFLADRLGCRYHEGPFADLDELASSLRVITPGTTTALVVFNDTVLLAGAVNVLLEIVRERGLALFWVNNWPIARAGGVADFSSDFEKAGGLLGEMAMKILRDSAPIDTIPFCEDPGERFGLNLRRCAELGITVRDEVRARFHAVQAIDGSRPPAVSLR